jgi:hypothetical protein
MMSSSCRYRVAVLVLLAACATTPTRSQAAGDESPVNASPNSNPEISASSTRPIDLVAELLRSILPTKFDDCGESVIRLTESANNAAEKCAATAVAEERPFLLIRRTHGVDSTYVEVFFQNERTQNFRLGFDANVCGFVNDSVAGCGPALGLEPCIFELSGPAEARHVVCPERR